MTLSKFWKRHNGPTLLQLRWLEAERAQEQMMEQELSAMFAQNEALARLEKAHREFLEKTEKRITDGWQPNAAEWAAIELNLKVFAKRRKELTDPLGIGELAKAVAEKRERDSKINETWRRYMRRLY